MFTCLSIGMLLYNFIFSPSHKFMTANTCLFHIMFFVFLYLMVNEEPNFCKHIMSATFDKREKSRKEKKKTKNLCKNKRWCLDGSKI